MVEYKDRLAQAMEEAGVSTAELAVALKISYQAVRKVLLGGQFGMDNNARAAKRLRVRSDWLATGKGPKKVEEWPFSDELRTSVLALSDDELYRLETVMRAHLGINQPSLSVVSNSRKLDTDRRTNAGHHPRPEDGTGLPEDVALPPPVPKQHERSTQARGRTPPKGRSGP